MTCGQIASGEALRAGGRCGHGPDLAREAKREYGPGSKEDPMVSDEDRRRALEILERLAAERPVEAQQTLGRSARPSRRSLEPEGVIGGLEK